MFAGTTCPPWGTASGFHGRRARALLLPSGPCSRAAHPAHRALGVEVTLSCCVSKASRLLSRLLSRLPAPFLWPVAITMLCKAHTLTTYSHTAQ